MSSTDGPLGDKVMDVRRALGNWIRSRKDVLMPKWLRGVARLIMKGDQKVKIINKKFRSITTFNFLPTWYFACFFVIC